MKKYEDNPGSIKYHVKKYLLKHQDFFKNKLVVDLPAGNGITCRILKDIGAIPIAFDLFPEYFDMKDIDCKRADVMEGIPLENNYADAVICQEGIEHFTDQFKVLKEFSRILKPGGQLIITTPNYSNLKARMSYFLSESERFNSIMPPNEIDSIWMNKQDISSEIYFGHVFLIGIQKLRLLAKLAGFKIKKIQFTRLKTGASFIFLFTYPFIFLSYLINYLKNRNKETGYEKSFQRAIYKEIFLLGINPKIMLDGHLFVVFEKMTDSENVMSDFKSVHKDFGTT